MNAIKALLVAALVAAAAFGVQQLRSHWIGLGEAQVQARWDAERALAAEAAASQAADQNRDDLARFRAAERTADEQSHLAQSREARLAAARAESERLRHALEQSSEHAAAGLPEAGGASAAALAGNAATARELLGRCQARYLAVAAGADELRDQVAGLQADAQMCRGATAP